MSQAAGVASSISVPAPTFLQRQGQASRVEFLGQEFGKEKLPILFYMVKPKHGKITFLCQVFAFQASTELKTCGPPQSASVCLLKIRQFFLWLSLLLPASIFKAICNRTVAVTVNFLFFKIVCWRNGRRERHMLAVEIMPLCFPLSRLSYFQKRVKYHVMWFLSFFVSVTISQR